MPTPMTAEAFQQRYTEVINGFKERRSLTETEFRRLYRLRLLREKLQEVAPLDVATTEAQVHARHILIRFPEVSEEKTQEQAEAEALARIQEIRRRIEAGESFADVAKAVSEDPGSKENGGDLGWFGRGRMVSEFEEAAFALEPGQISEPVKTAFGYHLIQVLEKDPARPVDEATLAQRRQQAFADWLLAQQNAAQIERRWRSDLVPALPDDLRQFLASVNTALAVPVPTPTPTP
jgi:parvulin-like peptidyl-prolyl isomerase